MSVAHRTPLQRFAEQAVARPDVPAVVDGTGSAAERAPTPASRTLTYGELLRRAQAVAARIERSAARAATSSPDGPRCVGLAMPIGADRIAALLGVLLAGRPYLPLDLSLPTERWRHILAEADPEFVLTDEEHARRLEGAAASLRPDPEPRSDPLPDGARHPLPAVNDLLAPDDLAYVMYTSGSTGRPKGVAMRYGALAALMEWQARDERLGRPARTAHLTPVTFDVSFQEIMGCLGSGGTLVVCDPSLRRDPASLLRFLEAEKIERLYLPYVGLQQLAEAAAGGLVPRALRDVVTAGEQLQVTGAIAAFFRDLPGCRLHNHYGPCETHVVTAYTLPADVSTWPPLPPIGIPLPGTVVHLLDEKLAPVPVGEVGELFLGGGSLARGYVGRPEETSARFLADPFAREPGARMYRTGDLGRRGPGGLIEWVGRSDDQVKIRGHRVELGEVETVLAGHPSVAQAVVVPRTRGGHAELVAYIRASVEALRSGAEGDGEVVSDWREVWDRTYSDETTSHDGSADAPDPTFDLAGWNSSFTGRPLGSEVMREWVDTTAARLLSLHPRRVLEVGVGTGLLLFRVAPHSERYVGIDYSEPAVRALREKVGRMAPRVESLAGKVEVLARSAADLGAFPPRSFDLVVLNSVVQHFPSAHYLIGVLREAVELVEEGGTIFVGDVSPRGFGRVLFAAIEDAKGRAAGEGAEAVRARLAQRLYLDRELRIDPGFFDALGGILPRVRGVEVQLKRGRGGNELTDYRYDVAIHLDGATPPRAGAALGWVEIPAGRRTPRGLVAMAAEGRVVREVPNRRLVGVWAAARVLESGPGGFEVPPAFREAVDPEEVYASADELGIAIELRPSDTDPTFRVGAARARFEGADSPRAPRSIDDLLPLCTHPNRSAIALRLAPELRAFAARKLPDYMVPSDCFVVEGFPTTPSGKVDRRALPELRRSRPALARGYLPPRTELEVSMAEVWLEVLGIDRVGIDDGFFDLGGNSGLVLGLVRRLGEKLGRSVPVVAAFEFPTIRTLAAHLEGGGEEPATGAAESRGERQRKALASRLPRRQS